MTWKIKKIEQKLQSRVNFGGFHAKNPSEVHHGFLDGKFTVQGYFLRHVSHPFPWYARSFGSWLSSKHPYLSCVQSFPSHYAGQQGCFAASWGTKEAVTENNVFIKRNVVSGSIFAFLEIVNISSKTRKSLFCNNGQLRTLTFTTTVRLAGMIHDKSLITANLGK